MRVTQRVTHKFLRMTVALNIALKLRMGHARHTVSTRLLSKHPRILSGLMLRPATDRSRGDVPGWVLITLMSAVLVAGLLAIAGPALERLFNQAMDQVQP